MLDIHSHAEGSLLPIRADPAANRNAICGEIDGRLRVSVTAAPERGAANRAIVKTLAKSTSIKRSQVTLLSGETHRNKVFLIAGWTPALLAAELERTLS